MNMRQESLLMLDACVIRSRYNSESVFALPEDYQLLDFLLETRPELSWREIEHYVQRLGRRKEGGSK